MTLLRTLVTVTLFVVTPPVGGGKKDAQTPHFQSVTTPLKINTLHITPWRFGSDHCPF